MQYTLSKLLIYCQAFNILNWNIIILCINILCKIDTCFLRRFHFLGTKASFHTISVIICSCNLWQPILMGATCMILICFFQSITCRMTKLIRKKRKMVIMTPLIYNMQGDTCYIIKKWLDGMSKCKVILLKCDGYYKTHDILVRRLSGRLKIYASRMNSMFHISVQQTMYMSCNRYVLSYFTTKQKLIFSLNQPHITVWIRKQAQQTPAHMFMYAYFLFSWKQLSRMIYVLYLCPQENVNIR